jgi:tRNA pseudouridine(55) synthase
LVEVDKDKFAEVAGSFTGKFFQKYPAYSSKTVDGAQMHELSRKGEVFDTPAHEVSMHSVKVVAGRKVSGGEVLRDALISAHLVSGDFRQKEIRGRWTQVLRNSKSEFDLFKMELSVSSGFYVRRFAHDIGEKLGVPAFAYSIKRTKAGEWGVDDCL